MTGPTLVVAVIEHHGRRQAIRTRDLLAALEAKGLALDPRGLRARCGPTGSDLGRSGRRGSRALRRATGAPASVPGSPDPLQTLATSPASSETTARWPTRCWPNPAAVRALSPTVATA